MFVWRGPLRAVQWPRHPQSTHDLPIEIWGTTKKSRLSGLIPRDATFTFKEFVQPINVPLWTVWGPELNVHSTSEETLQFFGELAASRWAIMSTLTSSPPTNPSSAPVIDHIVFYAVKDEGDPKWRISARPLVLAYADGPPTLTFTPPTSTLDSRPPTPDAIGSERNKSNSSRSETRSLQQIVMAALRLRGVRSDDPSFKQLYHLCFRGVEYALRKHESPMSLEKIREKVEALLTVLEC